MPTLPIPFTSMNKSVDKSGSSVFTQGQIDGYFMPYEGPDGTKYMWCKRPGKMLHCDLQSVGPVDGLHHWVRQNKVIASCNGKVYRIDQDGTITTITGTATMTARNRPTFADVAGSSLYIASGGRIGAFPAAGTGAYLTDGDAPTATRFIATINKVLVALRDDSERFDWADAGDPTTWTSLFATAEAEPDLARCMKIANQYLYFFGQNTTEVWRDNGESFVREGQGAIARGTLARYSVTDINGSFYLLDNTREVIRLNGFSVEVISNPALSRYLRSFSTVDDAIGDYLRIEGKHFYILSFPVEGKTLVYDIQLNHWHEWSYWNPETAQHDAWIGNCVVEAPDWNKTLIGDRRTGKIWEMTGTTDDGADIRTVIRTDFIDRGQSDNFKFCHDLTMIFKRADTNTTPKTMGIRWRDEGSTDWSATQEVEIEAQGHTELRVQVRRLGRYKRRQWEFIMSDPTQAALLSVTERFDYGR